jgi:HTH-type transcriptional regulator, sugar sensing transcriptional regulator
VDRTECTEALAALGFTSLEAEVYAVLVEQSPVTAYKVAQEVGKAAANVYKAVESLQRKGAILVEETSSRLCRAVPPPELIQQLERQFSHARSRAQTALAQLARPVGDERVYDLGSSEQVLARARAMLRRTERMVLCDLFPEAALELREDVEAAARRGRRVCVQLYRPAPFDPRVTVFVKPDGERLLRLWPGQWLNIVSDAREHLLAFLKNGLSGVHQAVWSESVYLSLLHFSGFASEMIAGAAGAILDADGAPEPMRRAHAAIRDCLNGADLPGYTSLLARFGAGAVRAAAQIENTKGVNPKRRVKKTSSGKRKSKATAGE